MNNQECLNPSFSGWPALGKQKNGSFKNHIVLIPLLVDDPLWVWKLWIGRQRLKVLIPLLVDDPLWALWKPYEREKPRVLIPLLVDDPLWVVWDWKRGWHHTSLNPSFSGWPALGNYFFSIRRLCLVLIPLLVDDPLWVKHMIVLLLIPHTVLIPLLVDDPLWVCYHFLR